MKKNDETGTASAALGELHARGQLGRSAASPLASAGVRPDAHTAKRGPTRPDIPSLKGFAPTVHVPPARGPLADTVPKPPGSSALENTANAGTALRAIDEAVDAALDALFDPDASPAAVSGESDHAADRRAVAETFASMARLHTHPLRELMFQLSAGQTPRSWTKACRPLLRPLFDAANQIGLSALVSALGEFDAALVAATNEAGAFIGDASRETLKRSYERLRAELPEAFGAPDRADNPQRVLLEALLLQVPSLQRRTLAKLYAAGLSSLSQLSEARPEELCAVAGLDRELACNLVEHVQQFQRTRAERDPAADPLRVQAQLRSLVARLSQLQCEFEQAEQADDLVGKKAARRAREASLLELDLAFAEIGEVALIEELKRCPVRSRILRVESYLMQRPGASA